jgi:hypothetical protein
MTEDVLRTKRLEVVDDQGIVRIMAGTGEQGTAVLGISDQNQNPRAMLSVNADGTSSVTLNDDTGTPLVSLSVRPEGQSLQISEPTTDGSVARITLNIRRDSKRAALTITDDDGEPRAMVMVREDGKPAFIALEEDGSIAQTMTQE